MADLTMQIAPTSASVIFTNQVQSVKKQQDNLVKISQRKPAINDPEIKLSYILEISRTHNKTSTVLHEIEKSFLGDNVGLEASKSNSKPNSVGESIDFKA